MTKAAAAALARGLAIDLAPRGIRVNTIQPGPIVTETNPSEGAKADFIRSLIPLGRMGTEDEVAGMVVYLAGPEAGFVTGSALNMDGGILA